VNVRTCPTSAKRLLRWSETCTRQADCHIPLGAGVPPPAISTIVKVREGRFYNRNQTEGRNLLARRFGEEDWSTTTSIVVL
jgi:hypothetical protein